MKMANSKSRPPRRQPLRTCIVCREVGDKRGLVRIVQTAQHGVQIDERGKMPGRGAYLCHKPTCWQSALHSQAIEQALKTELNSQEREQLEIFSNKIKLAVPANGKQL